MKSPSFPPPSHSFLTPHSLSLALSSPFLPSLLISPLSCRVDFAVSAPYEPDGDSTGVVYVYYGSGDLDLFRSQTPVRVSEGRRKSTVKGDVSLYLIYL